MGTLAQTGTNSGRECSKDLEMASRDEKHSATISSKTVTTIINLEDEEKQIFPRRGGEKAQLDLDEHACASCAEPLDCNHWPQSDVHMTLAA